MNIRIKDLRTELGLSQKQFGQKLHLSVSQISSYENNYRNIPDRTVADIIRVFNVNPKWIKEGLGDVFIENINDKYCLIEKINSLSKDDQIFILRIIDCLYSSSIKKNM